jgi:hypothetical protein
VAQQILEHNSYDENELESYQMAKELREMYDLPPINIQKQQEGSIEQLQTQHISSDIITNLNGLLKDYADSEENPIDAIKFIRENIS